jgi:diacylglycerol kinase (ATP)
MEYTKISLPQLHKVMFLLNKNSGKQIFASMLSRINETVELLRFSLPETEIDFYGIREFSELPEVAEKIQSEHYEWVIIAGGDGTIRAMIDLLVQKNCPAYISVFPAGTVNLIAKELMLSLEPEKWVRHILKGLVQPVYLGRANGAIFLTVAGVGFDSLVVDNVSLLQKKLLSKFAYLLTGGETMSKELLISHWRYNFTVRLEGDPKVYNAASVIVGKSRYYAGRYSLFSDAALHVPFLHVAMFTGHKRADFLKYATLIAMEALTSDKSIIIKKAKKVTITCNEDEFPVELDGDAVTATPLTLEIIDQPVHFII